MKNLVDVRIKGELERRTIYLSDLMETLKKELSDNEEVRKDTLNGLYHNMRNLLLSEIKVGDLEPIKMNLPEEEYFSIPNTNSSHVLIDDYLNNARINYSNEWTPVLLYEKLFSNIVKNKLKLLEIREELKRRKVPLSLTKTTEKEILDIKYVGNHKKKDLTISGILEDIEKLFEDLSLGIFDTKLVQYNEIENILTYFNLIKKKPNATILNSIVRLSEEILDKTKKIMYMRRVDLLMARESYRALLEMNEIGYAINGSNNDIMINVKYDSDSARFLTYDELDEKCKLEFLNKGNRDDKIIPNYGLFNMYVRNNNKRLQEYKNSITWIIKLYELIYCDVYLSAENYTLTEDTLKKMYKDILTHRAIDGQIDYINESNIESEPENFFEYISENIEIFPYIFERVINFFFDTYFFKQVNDEDFKGLGALMETPTKITMKNYEYINEYLFTHYEKDLNMLMRKVNKANNKNL